MRACSLTPSRGATRAECRGAMQRLRGPGRSAAAARRLRALSDDGRVVVDVKDKAAAVCANVGGDGTMLADYIHLPVDQFILIDMPPGTKLNRLGGPRFMLELADIKFFDFTVTVQISALVETIIDQAGNPAVRITAERCVVGGSQFVESLGITDRIDFKVWTVLSASRTSDGREQLLGDTHIYVLVDPPAPFSFLGDGVLSATANSVLGFSLKALQQPFVENVTRDYAAWATDPAYRASRAQMAEAST
ncbi:unnamed protein product [Pedinophyceae sp. YPF-701]|nr:unnamed protein product [Pedinophyceae sp. YPF-701]